MKAPESYAEWADVLDALASRRNDAEVLSAMQAGTLPFADASVTGATLIDPDSKDGAALDIQNILTGKKADQYRFVICNFDAVIYGDGEVAGYTSNGSFDSSKNCVTVPAGQTVVVLFR